MRPTRYVTQILLEPEKYAALEEIARRENRSLSDLVSDILCQWLEEHNREAGIAQELQALDELTQMRLTIQEQHS